MGYFVTLKSNPMEGIFLCIVVFLLLLAVFDLSVGVSNDAVNFLNSALGSKAAPFKVIITVAAVGVFLGASMSNGMMDIARHGIFRPENFSFYDLATIFMAVIVTDIILLDIFNTLGMPTSTTVSMVFEMLGASFVVSLIKMSTGSTGLGLAQLLNTEKALSVIIGIFLSVAIAFIFGILVQFIVRTIFSFGYLKGLKWKIGIFGGICATIISYFLLIKGAKDLTFMTSGVKEWIGANVPLIITCCFIFFTALMQLLYFLKVNVLKVVVLMGTFALAMSFAGNDLVNFVGVPLTGLASYQDYIAGGGGDAHSFMMGSLNGPAHTPLIFLIASGAIMVTALLTSKKSRKVSKTEIGLGSQVGGDEMFGSSRIARSLVRWSIQSGTAVKSIMPSKARRWLGSRFNPEETVIEDGASFDLVRGSVNLVLAAALIALGTSLKLPLSTTFVTFMVAMGTSLSDKAWGRESAVFRITGVISVIGGWFLTAGAAFIGAGLIAVLTHFGGFYAMVALASLTIFIIIRSNRRFSEKKAEDRGDVLFHAILTTEDKAEVWELLKAYITQQQSVFLSSAKDAYNAITTAFVSEDLKTLSRTDNGLYHEKGLLKSSREKETLCLRRTTVETAIEKNAWFHLSLNCCTSILYNLRRIAEICREHVENNFRTLPPAYSTECEKVRGTVSELFDSALELMKESRISGVPQLRRRCDEVKDQISASSRRLHEFLRTGDTGAMTVIYVYLNMLQETQELVSSLRKYVRAYAKIIDSDYTSRHEYTAEEVYTTTLLQ